MSRTRATASRRLWPLVLALLLLDGCALLPWQGPDETGTARTFEMLGRMSVRHQERVLTGTIRWQHAPARDEVWLLSPFGEALAHIVREPGGASLTTADQQTHRARSIAALTRAGLGWAFPLADLGYVLFGELPPGAAGGQVERTPDGRLARFADKGWEVELTAFGEVPAPHAARLRLRSSEVEIRLAVDRIVLN